MQLNNTLCWKKSIVSDHHTRFNWLPYTIIGYCV